MTLQFPDSRTLTTALISVLTEANNPLNSSEIDDLVTAKLNLPSEITEMIRQGSRTEIKYRLAWCRTKAKQSGLIEKLPSKKWQLKK